MITFVLFLFSLTQFISQSSQLDVAANLTMIKNYRRFELTIGNLILKESIDKHCGGKLNLRGCTLKSYVNFNQIHDSRDINLNEEYDEVHGIFVFHLIVWNGYKNEDKVFTEQTTLQILLSIQKNTKVEHIYYKKYINLIKAVSNSEKIFDLNLSEYEKFGIYVHYRCLGWIGFNCQFRCDTDKYDIECDYETGIAFCKNQQYLNPPYCNSSDSTCDAKETAMCQNNAICAKTFANTFQCLCPSGFGGKYCQNYNCEPPCDVNFGECIGPNKCKCLVDYKQGQFCNITKCNDISCLNDGVCKVHKNEIFCICNSESYSGPRCEFTCTHFCVYGLCSYYNSETFCDCFDGYDGDDCSILITQLAPIIEKGHVSPRNQKLVYVATSFLLFVISFVTFGVGCYVRNNINRKLKIIKRAYETLQSLFQSQGIVNIRKQKNRNSYPNKNDTINLDHMTGINPSIVSNNKYL